MITFMAKGLAETNKPMEHHGWDDESHEHHGEHAHDGNLRQGVKSRMTGCDERADTNEHDECRQDDRPSVGGQHRPAMGVLIDGALSHEDRIVVTLTKDERAQNDIDDIELDAQQGHDS